MSPLVLVLVVVVGMAIVAARLIMGAGPRKDKPTRPKNQKPARKSVSKKPKRKAAKKRKPGLGHLDDDDLLEMIFETTHDKRK